MAENTINYHQEHLRPLITAICPTYGRHKLLEEALQSFLMQTYTSKEMIILNDLPGQKLIFEHPEVRVINTEKRFGSFGEKWDFALEQVKGAYITSWADDDIILPHYLNLAFSKIEDKNESSYFGSIKIFYSEKNLIKKIVGNGMLAGSLYPTATLMNLRPLPKIGGELDVWITRNLFKRMKVIRFSPELKNEEIFYIFRWATGSYHLEGFGTDKPGEKKGWDKIKEMVESKSYAKEVILKPHWERDYVADAKTFLERILPPPSN